MKRRTDPRQSIRRRLLQRLVAPVAAVLVVGTAVELFVSSRPIHAAYDRAMADAALALALNVQVDQSGRIDAHVSQETLNVLRTDIADDVFYQIRAPDGAVLAGDADLSPAATRAANPAYQTVIFRGKRVRLMTYQSRSRAGDLLITMAETLNKRDLIRARIRSTALWSNALELLAVLACVWFAVRAALRPLDEFGDQIARRSAADLAPIPDVRVPLELRGVMDKLNSLLATIEAGSRAERDFLDSAAHQLRTPLTGLLAQLELLAADEREVSRHAQICHVRDAARRLARTTQQLLALAKSGHRGHAFTAAGTVDLSQFAADAVARAVQRATAAGVDLGAELAPAQTPGIAWLLAEALDNLIDNALIYTPPGGLVTVRTGMHPEGVFLEVADTGNGIPPGERQKVLERFYRGEHSRGTGSGLGLAIVAEVARQHGAVLTIATGDQDRGVCIRLDFLQRTL